MAKRRRVSGFEHDSSVEQPQKRLLSDPPSYDVRDECDTPPSAEKWGSGWNSDYDEPMDLYNEPAELIPFEPLVHGPEGQFATQGGILLHLPEELWVQVFNCLPQEERMHSLSFVCRHFYHLVHSSNVSFSFPWGLREESFIRKKLMTLTTLFSSVVSLDLASQQLLTDDALAAVAPQCCRLLRVNLSGCGVTSFGVSELLRHAVAVQSLNISACSVDAGAFRNLPKSLRVLSCQSTDFSEEHTRQLVSRTPHLEYLDLSNCCSVQNRHIIDLLWHLRELRVLVIDCNKQLTSAVLQVEGLGMRAASLQLVCATGMEMREEDVLRFIPPSTRIKGWVVPSP